MTASLSNKDNKDIIFAALDKINENILSAAADAGRKASEISLMAVTKTVPAEYVNHAIEWGVKLLGENRAQELCEKYPEYDLSGETQIHFIGSLQTNKVRLVADKVSMIHSLDNIHLAAEIDKQCRRIDKTMDVLIEINIGNELSKGGISPNDAEQFIESLSEYKNLRLRGLMTIPPFDASEYETECYFDDMYKLFVDIADKKLDNNYKFDVLSMGMSGDYPLAIKHGANIVRIGTAIFGGRRY